jgi:energy-coupling factor transporter ATP-binding protein EcfA2
MRITDIYLKNYRAFYGEHHFNLEKDGKNLMVYGENGSGKSSLFTALQTFMLSSVKKVVVEENVFIPISQQNTASIKLTIRENASATASQEFEVNIANGQIIAADKTIIENANKIKGFFDYRRLLETHLNHIDNVNVFKLLIENVLPHAENRFTTNEIGSDWRNIYYQVHELRQGNNVVDYIKKSIENFNKGLTVLLKSIQDDTNTFLSYFDKGMSVEIAFNGVSYGGRRIIRNQDATLKIIYGGKEIAKHHLFLNEARLSALAISLYLASIRVNPLTGTLKVLVLDDLLIGLDMSNRLPLLEILKKYFIETQPNEAFQIIMTTYDKVWFELVNNYFGSEKWKYIEIYSKKLTDQDFEFPVIKDTLGYLKKAKFYLDEKDNKASAVYIRTEFEKVVKSICEKKVLQVNYKIRQKDFSTEDFWDAITNQTDLDRKLIKEIEIHRGTVMNPFSHYDLEKPEFTKELEDTIISIEKLGKVSIKDLKKRTYTDVVKELKDLEWKIKKPILQEIVKHLISKSNSAIKT